MEIKTPTNVVELMENLLAVFRNRQVFDEAFYTEENIRQLTAAQDVEVIRDQNNPLVIDAEIYDFQTIIDRPLDFGGGISISIQHETRPDGKKSVILRCGIIHDHPLLHYLAIEKRVGHPWRPKAPRLDHWSTQRRYHKPTDPYGNAEREYSRQDDHLEETGTFRFDEAGHLNSLFLRGEER